MPKNYHYLRGFANHHCSEASPSALPQGQNAPQKPPLGLYTEQLSGTAFTAPKSHNKRSWLYRILPSVKHQHAFKRYANHPEACLATDLPPTPMRWDPLPYPTQATDFIDGLMPFAGNGNAQQQLGALIYLYACNQSMQDRFFYSADGEWLIVPQHGELVLHTEFGPIDLQPGEIGVVPRGVKFQVELCQEKARGYVLENFGAPFTLPERGPIGANGLANERDFLIPCATFEERQGDFELLCKFQQKLWTCSIQQSPLDVVAWHGNYTPYKYDLRLFNTLNTVSFDHPDPSIFTVLTSQSDTPGIANVDFVIFPDRWMVAEHTFRLPYYHRNVMSEFMGLIYGAYDAKQKGFVPGGCSLHNCMTAHGPDSTAFKAATNAPLKPEYYHGSLAFMFESRYAWRVSEFALNAPIRQQDYTNCWEGLHKHFKGG